MKTQKLIPLLDYVLENTNDKIDYGYNRNEVKVHNYAKFLSQPLKLSQFVPCDQNGNILEEPKRESFSTNFDFKEELYIFNEAKANVLFEGFHLISDDKDCPQVELKNGDLWLSFLKKTVIVNNEFGHEYNVYLVEGVVDLDLTLTENAVKLING